MVTKKIRTEYMKKFRDPKWETFSKCYEDSLKYRLTRRLMEHSHKPWFWEGWEGGSDSSGRSTPRLTRNRVVPLSLPPPPPMPPTQVSQKPPERKAQSPGPRPPSEDGEPEVGGGETAGGRETAGGGETAVSEPAAPTENGVKEAGGGSAASVPDGAGPSDDTATDNGPLDTESSDGELLIPAPRRRHRCRAPRSEPGHRDDSRHGEPPAARKQQRAKSQPPGSAREKRWSSGRPGWTERQTDAGKTPRENRTCEPAVQVRRQSDKRSSNPDRRRARSADLEKLMAADDRWVTEYMRCFSARLR